MWLVSLVAHSLQVQAKRLHAGNRKTRSIRNMDCRLRRVFYPWVILSKSSRMTGAVLTAAHESFGHAHAAV